MTQLPDPGKPVPTTASASVQKPALQVPAGSLAHLLQGFEAYTLQALRHRYLLQSQGGRLHPEHIPLNRMESVLDVGCGIGEWMFGLTRRYPKLHIYGIDIDAEALEHATARRNSGGFSQLTFRQMDILRPWPIPAAYFDFIHIGHCGTALAHDQWSPVLRECLRVLKPGGWLNVVEMEFGSISSPAFMALHAASSQVIACATKSHAFASRTCEQDRQGSALATEADRQGSALHFDTTEADRQGSALHFDATHAAPNGQRREMYGMSMSMGVASRLYSMLLREQLDDVNYDLYTVDLGFLGGNTAHALLIGLLYNMLVLKPLIVQANLFDVYTFDVLVRQAQAELQAPQRCGWAMLISAFGRASSGAYDQL